MLHARFFLVAKNDLLLILKSGVPPLHLTNINNNLMMFPIYEALQALVPKKLDKLVEIKISSSFSSSFFSSRSSIFATLLSALSTTNDALEPLFFFSSLASLLPELVPEPLA